MKQATQHVALDGNLWFTKAESKFLGGDRIALLEKDWRTWFHHPGSQGDRSQLQDRLGDDEPDTIT